MDVKFLYGLASQVDAAQDKYIKGRTNPLAENSSRQFGRSIVGKDQNLKNLESWEVKPWKFFHALFIIVKSRRIIKITYDRFFYLLSTYLDAAGVLVVQEVADYLMGHVKKCVHMANYFIMDLMRECVRGNTIFIWESKFILTYNTSLNDV